MPSTADANLLIKVGGDVSSLSRDLGKGSRGLDKFEKTAKRVGGALAAFTAVATASGGALALMAASAANNAAEIRALASVANTGTTQFQKMAAGAKSVFIEQDKLADILKDVNDRIGDFVSTGGGPMADFFENIAPRIGVTIEQFRKLSGPEALQLYYNSLEKANLNQQDMTFYMEAMASDATALIPLLKNNGAEFRRLGDEAERYGRVLSETDIENLTKSKKAFSDIADSVKSLRDNIATKLNPEIELFRDLIVEATSKINDAVDKIAEMRDKAREQAKVEKEINEIIGKRVDRRGRLVAMASEEASQMNDLLSRQAELEGLISQKIEGGGRSRAAARKEQQEMLPVWQEELEAINKQVDQLAIQSAQAQKIFDLRKGTLETEKELKEIEEAGGNKKTNPNDFGFGDLGGDPFQNSLDDDNKARIQATLERYQTERDLYAEHLQIMADLEAGFDAGKIETKQEYYEKVRQAEQEHQDQLMQLVKSGNASREAFDKLSMKNKVKVVASSLSEITAGVAQHNKAMFNLNKAAGIAEAIVNAYQGISKTMAAYPYPINIGMAAAHAAAAFAQVNAIRSSSFNGGGGTAPSAAATSATPVQNVGGGGSGESRPPQSNGTLHVTGLTPNIRDLAQELLEYQRNGGEVVLSA